MLGLVLTDHLQVNMPGDASLYKEIDCKVPAPEIESGADDEIRNLRDNLSSNKCYPVVCFRLRRVLVLCLGGTYWVVYLFLPSLEQVPILQEERLHLVDTAWRHKDEVEDCKQSQLQREGTIVNHPESETAEQSREDVKGNFVPDVILRIC